MNVILLFAVLAITSAEICRPTNKLQALDQTFKSHEDHILFGRLTACPREGEDLSPNIRYRLVNPIDGLVVQEQSGGLQYTPPDHFSGTVHFDYYVEDETEQTEPARVTITIREVADEPNLDVSRANDVVVGLEGEDILLDIRASLEDQDGSEQLTVALCSCAQDITCNRYSGKCHCHLSMPEGWHIYDSNDHLLPSQVLANLGADDLEGLYLRPDPLSSGDHCLDVYAISHDRNNLDPQGGMSHTNTKQQMRINVRPLVKDPHVMHGNTHTPNNATQFYTTEGQPIQFTSLKVKDNDGVEGIFRVRVSVNEGGTLWVRQDIRDDVVFFPKETEIRADRTSKLKSDKKKPTVLLDRHDDFHDEYRPFNTTLSNNGKKTLEFMGSVEGVNEVLSTLLFVPWCSQWPTPPNWNLPESSWMVPGPWDELSGMNSEERPVVWPQWYPRFWYPFPIKNWSWWPRVLPPWWLEQRCSDWTSHVHLEAQEITPQTCDVDTNHPKAIWDGDVHVESRTGTPKSLITDNLFTYYPDESPSFRVKNIYIRSTEEEGKLRFTLRVNRSIASVENMETRLPTFSCYTVTECNNLLKQIRVDIYDNGVCHIPVEISMYKGDSERLSDYMMVWGVKSTDDCVNIRSNYPQFEMSPMYESNFVGQDGTVPLNIEANIHAPDMKGILHTTIKAQDGLVTLSVPTGMRIYFDHMGRHHEGEMVTNFCMSGPAFQVIEALKTAQYTPLKNFKGITQVVVEYGMTRTSLQHTYGIPKGTPIPKQSFAVKINVVNGQRPYFPVLSLPEKECSYESDITPLDMIRLERRYQEDEIVSMSLYADQGTLTVDSEISALYDCPAMGILSSCAIPDGCFTDDTCPGNQRCCGVAPDCGKQCRDPIEVARMTSHNPHNVILHGKISTLNRVFEDMNIWYLAKPCQTDNMGRLITDRRVERQTDNIRISVVPSRNPEGDSVIKYLNLDITCNAVEEVDLTSIGVVPEPEPEDGCDEEWGPWSECAIENDEACGIGEQQRMKQCTNVFVESRPCLKCDCEVQNRTIHNPDYMMRTCESTRTVSMCPNTCQVDTSHHEIVEFRCSSDDLTDITIVTSDIRVHDECSCRMCKAYDVDKFGRLVDKAGVVAGQRDVNGL